MLTQNQTERWQETIPTLLSWPLCLLSLMRSPVRHGLSVAALINPKGAAAVSKEKALGR